MVGHWTTVDENGVSCAEYQGRSGLTAKQRRSVLF